MLAASQVQVTPKQSGLARLDANVDSDCFPTINDLLQNNHDNVNIFFRPVGGHNHTAHAILTVYAMGGSAEDLQRAFDDNDHQQIPMPPISPAVVSEMRDESKFLRYMRDGAHYANFLKFFELEIEERGWQTVLCEYCFKSTPVAKAMYVQLFEGLYHPLIHIGFGVEFDQPAIVAEGLAQAASHVWGNISDYFARCDEIAHAELMPTASLLDLYRLTQATDKVRTAAKLQQGPNRIKDGLMPIAMEEMASIAAQFRVGQGRFELEHALLETTSCAAFNAAAAQRKGKVAKIDFFAMHTVTSSLFISLLVHQPWMPAQYKAKLIESKGRLDLAWYASCSAPQLDLDFVTLYQPTIGERMDWKTLYAAIVKEHDDGHVAKFVRALYSAEKEAKMFEDYAGQSVVPTLPIHGDLWFRVAQMALDSTAGLQLDEKWLMGAGFDPVWMKVENAS